MLEGKHTLQLGGASSINQSLAELGAKVIKSEQLTVELEDHESNGNQDGLAESFLGSGSGSDSGLGKCKFAMRLHL